MSAEGIVQYSAIVEDAMVKIVGRKQEHLKMLHSFQKLMMHWPKLTPAEITDVIRREKVICIRYDSSAQNFSIPFNLYRAKVTAVNVIDKRATVYLIDYKVTIMVSFDDISGDLNNNHITTYPPLNETYILADLMQARSLDAQVESNIKTQFIQSQDDVRIIMVRKCGPFNLVDVIVKGINFKDIWLQTRCFECLLPNIFDQMLTNRYSNAFAQASGNSFIVSTKEANMSHPPVVNMDQMGSRYTQQPTSALLQQQPTSTLLQQKPTSALLQQQPISVLLQQQKMPSPLLKIAPPNPNLIQPLPLPKPIQVSPGIMLQSSELNIAQQAADVLCPDLIFEQNRIYEMLVTDYSSMPWSFWARLKPVPPLMSMMVDMASSRLVPLKTPSVGCYCAIWNEEFGYFARGLIESANLQGYSVRYIDFGTLELKTAADLFILPAKSMSFPQMSAQFQLSRLMRYKDVMEKEEALKMFTELTFKKVLKLKYLSLGQDGIHRCILYITNMLKMDEDVLAFINCLVHAKLEYSFECLKTHEVLDVLVAYVDSKHYFYVHPERNFDAVKDMTLEIKAMVSENHLPTPNLDELFTGMPIFTYDTGTKLWYRSKVLEVNKDKVYVEWVDYGERRDVSLKYLRMIPLEWIGKYPILAYKVRLGLTLPRTTRIEDLFGDVDDLYGEIFCMTVEKHLPGNTYMVGMCDADGVDLGEKLKSLAAIPVTPKGMIVSRRTRMESLDNRGQRTVTFSQSGNDGRQISSRNGTADPISDVTEEESGETELHTVMMLEGGAGLARRKEAPATRKNTPAARNNAPATRDNVPAMRKNTPSTSRQYKNERHRDFGKDSAMKSEESDSSTSVEVVFPSKGGSDDNGRRRSSHEVRKSSDDERSGNDDHSGFRSGGRGGYQNISDRSGNERGDRQGDGGQGNYGFRGRRGDSGFKGRREDGGFDRKSSHGRGSFRGGRGNRGNGGFIERSNSPAACNLAEENWDDEKKPSYPMGTIPPAKKYIVGDCLKVYLTIDKDPTNFVVVNMAEDDEYGDLMDVLQDDYENREPLSDVVSGANVVAECGQLGKFRGIVDDVKTNAALIEFVDTGVKRPAIKKEIWAICTNHCVMPARGLRCALNVEKSDNVESWPKNVLRDLFNRATLDATILEVNEREGKVVYTMKVKDANGADLADILVAKGCAVMKEVKEEEIVDLDLLKGQVLLAYIPYINDQNDFYIHLNLASVPTITSEIKKLNEKMLKNVPEERIRVGAFILTYSDEALYRARVQYVHIEEKTFDAKFIDFGDCVEGASFDKAFIIPDHLLKYNCQAVKCGLFLDGEEEFEGEMREKFGNEANDKDVIVRVVDVENKERLMVELFDPMGKAMPFPKQRDEAISPVCEAPILSGDMEVGVCFVDKETVFVQRLSDEKSISSVGKRLTNIYDAEEAPLELMVAPGIVYACKSPEFESWYRAKVLEAVQVDDEKVGEASEGKMEKEPAYRVHYIDFGNDEMVGKSHLRILKEEFTSDPALCLAFTGDFELTATSEAVADFIAGLETTFFHARVKRAADDVWMALLTTENGKTLGDLVVEKEVGVKKDRPEFRDETPLPKETPLERWPLGEKREVMMRSADSPTEFYVQLREDAVLADKMMKELSRALTYVTPVCGGKRGDLCGVLRKEENGEEVWLRGALGGGRKDADFGLDVAKDDVNKKLPQAFKRPPFGLAVKCALDVDVNKDVEAATAFLLEYKDKIVTAKSLGRMDGGVGLEVDLFVDGDVSLTKIMLEKGLVIRKKCCVKCTFAESLGKFFVHRVDQEEAVESMLEEMEAADLWEMFESPPVVGTLVAAKFVDDEQWYRAAVLQTYGEGGKSVKVSFVDYGNESECVEFKRLPDHLALLPKLATECRYAGEFSEEESRKFIKMVVELENAFYISAENEEEPLIVDMWVKEAGILAALKDYILEEADDGAEAKDEAEIEIRAEAVNQTELQVQSETEGKEGKKRDAEETSTTEKEIKAIPMKHSVTIEENCELPPVQEPWETPRKAVATEEEIFHDAVASADETTIHLESDTDEDKKALKGGSSSEDESEAANAVRLEEMARELEDAEDFEILDDVQVGNVVAALVGKGWKRGKVVEVEGGKMSVDLIDVGGRVEVEVARALPVDLVSLAPLYFQKGIVEEVKEEKQREMGDVEDGLEDEESMDEEVGEKAGIVEIRGMDDGEKMNEEGEEEMKEIGNRGMETATSEDEETAISEGENEIEEVGEDGAGVEGEKETDEDVDEDAFDGKAEEQKVDEAVFDGKAEEQKVDETVFDGKAEEQKVDETAAEENATKDGAKAEVEGNVVTADHERTSPKDGGVKEAELGGKEARVLKNFRISEASSDGEMTLDSST